MHAKLTLNDIQLMWNLFCKASIKFICTNKLTRVLFIIWMSCGVYTMIQPFHENCAFISFQCVGSNIFENQIGSIYLTEQNQTYLQTKLENLDQWQNCYKFNDIRYIQIYCSILRKCVFFNENCDFNHFLESIPKNFSSELLPIAK